jgi:uncharacterized protein (TIGR00725 family)
MKLDWHSRKAVAVLGGSLKHTERQVQAGFEVGRELARRKLTVLTGATSGIPYAASLGAHEAGGLVVGISPAASEEEHIQGGRPRDQADFIVYTGMGAEGRSPLIVRSAAASIFIGGEFGTLGELCSAWLCGCPVLGVLEEHGGLTDSIRSLVDQVSSSWGSSVVYGADPAQLVADIAGQLESLRYAEEPDALGEDVRRIVASLLDRGDVGKS